MTGRYGKFGKVQFKSVYFLALTLLLDGKLYGRNKKEDIKAFLTYFEDYHKDHFYIEQMYEEFVNEFSKGTNLYDIFTAFFGDFRT